MEVDRRTVSAKISEHGVEATGTQSGHPVYSVRAVASAVFSGTKPDGSKKELDPEEMEPKDRKDYYDSEKKRLEVEQLMGLLIPASEFHAEISAVCKTIAQFFDVLPDILERDCGLEPIVINRVQEIVDEQRRILAARVEDLEV